MSAELKVQYMDKSTDANLEELSPDELSVLERDLKEKLRVYLRHIVGLAGAYEHVQSDGIRKPQKPFYYSAAVIELRGRWYLLTAGHNLEKMVAAATRADTRLVACGLDDTYATASQDKSPLQHFDFEGAHRFYQIADGLDFGLIHVRPHYRALLSANGIQPLTEQHWNPTEVDACDVFLMVGFPEDSIDSSITVSQGYYYARAKGCPSVILINRLPSPPHERQTAQHPRFVGQIRPEHEVGNIVGMSGGPILCFKGHDFEPYFVAAIQSTWIEAKKITFGCPIPVILRAARDFLAENSSN